MKKQYQRNPLPGHRRGMEVRDSAAEATEAAEASRKVEATAPPHPQLEVLQERMNQLATKEQVGQLATAVEVLQERVDHTATKEQMGQMATAVEVLQERMDQMATKEQMAQMATKEQMAQMATKEQMAQMATKEQMSQMATRAEMYKLHGETMERMNNLHLAAMERSGRLEERMGKMESSLTFIKWVGSTLWVAIIAGLVKIIFFPVV